MECPSINVQRTAGNIRRQEGFGFRIGALLNSDKCAWLRENPKETLALFKSYSPDIVTLNREISEQPIGGLCN